MFLQASVILLTGGRGGTSHPPGADNPLGADTPLEQAPPRADTPQSRHPREQTPPQSRHPPEQTPPLEQTSPPDEHAMRYGQRAGGTHPTGMQSCIFMLFNIQY